MLGIFIFILLCHHGPPVSGARVGPIVVPSERNQNLFPHTLSTLASRANLGVKSSLRVNGEQDLVTAKGSKLRRMVQTYGGYEVYGSTVAAEVTMDGQYTGQLSGDVVMNLSNDIPDPEICKRDLDDVHDVAINAEGYSPSDPRIRDKNGSRIVYLNNFKGKMAYMVHFFIEDAISEPLYIIDACNDTIFTTYNLIRSKTMDRNSQILTRNNKDCGDCNPQIPGYGGNAVIGRTKYNVHPLCLKVNQSEGICTMEHEYGKVINNMGSDTTTKTTVISFDCSDGYRDPFGYPNLAYGVANDALYFSHAIGKFYRKKYSFKPLPWVPRLVVHYKEGYQNAFWRYRDMYFGDGGSYLYPLVVLDIVAHELAYGITNTNSNLEYAGESGGMNEAFSDISGEVAVYYVTGSNKWVHGEEVNKTKWGPRFFKDPTDDGYSIKHVRNYTSDLNVHFSSGIYNHVFWRMVEVSKMPIYDAYKCFLDANRSRWGKTTGFVSGSCHVARACYTNGFNHSHVISAFEAVGIKTVCSMSLHEATIFPGQSLPNFLVSYTRSPILELNLEKGRFTIETLSEDKSDVNLVLARDEGAEDVIVEEVNRLVIDSENDDNILYLQLKSTSADDTNVELVIKT